MTRYCVNATLEVDAWAYVEADTEAEAIVQSGELAPRDFEQGDPFAFRVESVEEDS